MKSKLSSKLRISFATLLLVLTTGALPVLANSDITGQNDTTGPNSVNELDWNLDQTNDINLDNNSTETHDFNFDSNSGNNVVVDNTEAGDIIGGDIRGDIRVRTDLNNGDWLSWFDNMDPLRVDVRARNRLTGPFSENTANVDINVDRNIDITNDSSIDNNINADLNSGNNVVSNNTLAGRLVSGDINYDVNIKNGSNGGNTLNLPSIGDTGQIDGYFENNTTGPNSVNTNNFTLSDNFNLNVTNTSEVTNNADITADSGNNTVTSNTVAGDVRTGDVRLSVDIQSAGN